MGTRKIVRDVLDHIGPGWDYAGTTGKSHLVFAHGATGATITVGCSPSSVEHALSHARQDARRAVRAAQARRA